MRLQVMDSLKKQGLNWGLVATPIQKVSLLKKLKKDEKRNGGEAEGRAGAESQARN